MPSNQSFKPKLNQSDSSREIKARIEANELRAREFESQARILEARLRLADAQTKVRERFPPAPSEGK